MKFLIAKKNILSIVLLLALMIAEYWAGLSPLGKKATPTPVIAGITKVTNTPVLPTFTRTVTVTLTPSLTLTPVDTATPTDTLQPSDTPTMDMSTPTETITPTLTVTASVTPTQGTEILPFLGAPLCSDSGMEHDNNKFHTLWDLARGCHYDHEHGQNPFTPQVAAVFPGFDLKSLLGGIEVGTTNPTSPMENTMKHGGFKWDVDLAVPCEVFEGAQHCVEAAVVEYHNFGDYSMEMETRNHSTVALVKACDLINQLDCGYMFVVQHQEYGQRVSQYQGDLVPYPNNPSPAYDVTLGPYFTIDRYGTCTGCRASLDFVLSHDANANSIWTSKPTGSGIRPETSRVFRLLFRVRDNYQLLDWASVANGYPFHFGFVCGGNTYNPTNCRYNNSTSRVHEVAGDIPATWDNLEGFDTNPTVGRITAQGYVTRFGEIALDCQEIGTSCFPIKLVDMFVGSYGGPLPGAKVSNPNPISNPERDIYFCGSIVCSETSTGAKPSGWIGAQN